MYSFLKALHVAFMFVAVTLLMGEAIFLWLAVWRRDVYALAGLQRLSPGLGLTAIGGIFFLAGIALGLILAATGHLNFLAGWLIVAYVGLAALVVNNALPSVQRLRPLVRAAAQAESGDVPAEDVVRSMDRSRPGLSAAVLINTVLFVAIILDMVLKPF
jgi:hypothetical protein